MTAFFYILILVAFVSSAVAGVLPTSRGGTGSNITPSNGSVVYSTASGFSLSSKLVVGSGSSLAISAGTTVAKGAPIYIIAGSTLATPERDALESNGTKLYWTDSTGTRHFINMTP